MNAKRWSGISALAALVGLLCLGSGSVQATPVTEVSQPVQVTSDSHYERGQSIVYDGADYWLFYGQSGTVTGNYDNSNPDTHDYTVYFKKASSVVGLASAAPTPISGVAHNANSYLGETGAAYLGGDVWALATIDVGATAELYGWYTSDGGTTWTEVGPIITGLSDGQAHHDEVAFGGELWVVEGSGNFTTTHSATPTTGGWSTPLVVDSSPAITGGLAHFFVEGSDLYLAAYSNGTNYIYKYNSGTDAWDKVDEITPPERYDPTLFKVGSAYVFAQAPWVSDSTPGGRQYIISWSSGVLDGTFFDGVRTSVTEGKYGANSWVDMWPIGFTDAGGHTYLLYTSERDEPTAEGTGNIWYLEWNWDPTSDHYTYIQEAVDAATSTTINVAAGTYNEQVVIDKANLTLDGPNAGVDPGCSGTRPSAEATISWSTLTGVGTASTVVIAADDVTVDGFTIQNTNGTQNQVSVLIGGHFVGDTTRPSDGSDSRNNIISNGYNNVYLWQSSDNTIERNRVLASVETEISIRDNAGQGTRNALRNSVLDNCIDKAGVASLGHSVAIGVTGGGAQDFTGTLIQGNTMKNSGGGTGHYRGIDANLANGSIAEPVRIYGNTITDTSEQGIRVESSNNYDIGGSSAATGNTITGSRGAVGGYRRGITTAGTSTGLAIQYNTISGHSSTSGNDAEIVVTTTGNTILHNTLFVADSAPDGAGGLGLRLDNPSNVFGENAFQGDGQRMLQASGAPGPGLTVVDVTASTFRTAAGTTLDPDSRADLVSIEDRVRHHLDVPGNFVLVIFKASTTVATALNNAATPGAIQRAVNAVPGSTVIVGPGTYNETVRLDSTKVPNISLIGDDKTTTFITGGIRFEGNYDGLSVENFTITGDGRQRPGLAEATVAESSGGWVVTNARFANNVFDGEGITGVGGGRFGFYLSRLGGSFTFEDNEVKDYRGWGTLELNQASTTVTSYVVTHNYIHDNSGSSALRGNPSDPTDTVTVTRNVFDNNGNASVESWASLEVNEAETVSISDNAITNTQAGLWGEGEALQFWHITSLTVTDNTIENNYQGIYFPGGAYSSDLSGVEIHSNSISGNTQFGLQADAGNTGTADAENNYWGTLSWYGYDAVSGIKDLVIGNADWEPWKDANLTTSYSKPTTTYVDDDNASKSEGQPGTSGGTFGYDAFTAVQDGINNVAGSTVNVADGVYTATSLASIVITKNGLSLIGQSRDGTIIDAGPWGTSGAGWPRGIHVYANDVTIRNLTVRGFTGDTVNTGGYGIVFRDWAHDMPEEGYIFYSGGIVENVKLENNYSSMYALVHRNLTVRDSLIQDSLADGMFIARESDNATITGNTVLNSGDHGIWVGYCWNALGPSDNAIITGNVVDGAREGGISFVASNTALISENDVSHVRGEEPGSADGWSRGAISLKDGVSNVTVSNNVVHDNDGLGTGSGRGIGVDGSSSYIRITGNIIRDNAGGGIKVMDTTSSWVASYNSIYGNTGYGAQNTTSGLLDFTSNWWGSCSGPYHPTLNPLGAGDAVSDNVDFDPWISGACDYDSDLLTNDGEQLVWLTDWQDPDTDDDGCADGEEALYSEPTLGGQRDPLDPWDFYDVPLPVGAPGTGSKNKSIDLDDMFAVLAKFGSHPSNPPGAPLYDAAYDRSTPTGGYPGPTPWLTEDPAIQGNGVQLDEVFWNLASFGHSCFPLP